MVNVTADNNINIRNSRGDIIGTGISGAGNIVGKEITIKGNVININDPSSKSLEELRKILAVTTEIPGNTSSVIRDTNTAQELMTLDKRIDDILNVLKTVEEKVGTHASVVKAGQYSISRVDLLLKRAALLTESTNRFWNVSSKGSISNNSYIRKNKEAYLLLKEANRIEPYNTEVLLLMAKVQAKLTPHNHIKMQKIFSHIKNLLAMPQNEAEKFQLAQVNFLSAIFSKPIDEPLLQDARVMFRRLGWTEWVRQCDTLLQPQSKKTSRTWTEKGWILGLLQRYEESIECFDRALEMDPRNLKALRGTASVLGRLERYEEAIKWFDRAIEIDPNNYGLYRSKGTAYYHQERYEEAIKCFDRALKIDSSDDNTWCSKGSCFYRIEKYNQAAESFDMALNISPDNADAWNSKGECLAKLHKYDEAKMCYDKSISIDQDNALVWYNKGLCLNNLQQYNDAEYCFNRSKELDLMC